jgi:hypothetical protein
MSLYYYEKCFKLTDPLGRSWGLPVAPGPHENHCQVLLSGYLDGKGVEP